MRHFRSSPLAITALACGMGEATSACFLVTPSGLALGLTAGGLRAALAAIAVAPVAVAADHHLTSATGAMEQTRTAAHRRLLPMSAGLEPAGERYSPTSRASHGLGVRHRGDCRGRARCRACLNGPDEIADSRRAVTSRLDRTATRAAALLSLPSQATSPHDAPPRPWWAERLQSPYGLLPALSPPGAPATTPLYSNARLTRPSYPIRRADTAPTKPRQLFTTLAGDLPHCSPKMRRSAPPSTRVNGACYAGR